MHYYYLFFTFCLLSSAALAETPWFKPNGRLQIDSGWVLEEDSPREFTDGAVFRRLWLGATGEISAEGWSYSVIGGQSGDVTALQDAYLRYGGLENFSLMLGQYKEHNGFESAVSNTNLMFLERANMVNTFRPRRNIGMSLLPHGKNWGMELGFFGNSLGSQTPDNDGNSLSTRAHIAPILQNDAVLHLGISYRRKQLEIDQERFRSRGESSRPEENLLDTRHILGLNGYETAGLEVYYANQPLTFMAEWQRNSLDRHAAAHVIHHGGNVAILWSLTGEQRGYDAASGAYKRLTPDNPITAGGIGAWEIGLRQSYLELNDEDIQSGRMDSTTLGINWYPENNLKLMANYSYHNLDKNAAYPDADPHYLLLRMQIEY